MFVQPFDRDVSLAELLDSALSRKLEPALAASLSGQWELVDADGHRLLGTAVQSPSHAQALCLDIEPLGFLRTDAPRAQLEAAATWLELVLRGALRYRMASDLHTAAVHADYEELQRKHEALQESEARYRNLSAELERRVDEQVRVIERAQRQLYQSEKMAAVGSLAAGMAHEINNPVGFIRSNIGTARAYLNKLQTLLASYRSGETEQANAAWRQMDGDYILSDFASLLDESADGAERVARIIASLKAYAAVDYATAAPVNLNEAVQTVLVIASDQASEQITYELDLQPVPVFTGDPGRINQMLAALLQNARQAVKKGGRIVIWTRIENGQIRLGVRDNGCGIAPGVLPRIFDPFFTTRDVGKGMGLGLTVSRDIATAHGGRIDVASSPGVGSTFTVTFPLVREKTVANPGAAA